MWKWVVVLVLLGACGADDAAMADAGDPELTVTWSITNAGAVASCEDVGALNVRVTAIDAVTAQQFSERYSCTSGTSAQPLPASTYQLAVDLLGSGSVVLAAATDDAVVLSGAGTTVGVTLAVP